MFWWSSESSAKMLSEMSPTTSDKTSCASAVNCCSLKTFDTTRVMTARVFAVVAARSMCTRDADRFVRCVSKPTNLADKSTFCQPVLANLTNLICGLWFCGSVLSEKPTNTPDKSPICGLSGVFVPRYFRGSVHVAEWLGWQPTKGRTQVRYLLQPGKYLRRL